MAQLLLPVTFKFCLICRSISDLGSGCSGRYYSHAVCMNIVGSTATAKLRKVWEICCTLFQLKVNVFFLHAIVCECSMVSRKTLRSFLAAYLTDFTTKWLRWLNFPIKVFLAWILSWVHVPSPTFNNIKRYGGVLEV